MPDNNETTVYIGDCIRDTCFSCLYNEHCKIQQERKNEVQSITVIGKRWFERINGNTYHTAIIMVNGKTIGNIPFSYGYDRMYLQNATRWLNENGYIALGQYPSGMYKPLWQYCEENKIHLEYWAIDVPRKKDL